MSKWNTMFNRAIYVPVIQAKIGIELDTLIDY